MRIKLNIIGLLLITFHFCAIGQTQTKDINVGGFELKASTVDPEINTFFCISGQMPIFPGGMDSLVPYALSILYYPETAKKDSVQGTVLLKFTVDTTGKVIDEIVYKNVRTDLDTLCLGMLRKMPIWTPGMLEGKPVAVQFMWPIRFTLTKKDDE